MSQASYRAIGGANGDDDSGRDSGSAYVFKREGQNWAQQARLTPPDGQSYDYFGQAVTVEMTQASAVTNQKSYH